MLFVVTRSGTNMEVMMGSLAEMGFNIANIIIIIIIIIILILLLLMRSDTRKK